MPAPSTDPTLPDPRPQLIDDDGPARLAGLRCTACGYPAATAVPWCPRCQAAVEPALFGPAGRVWSSTVVRVPLPGRTPPYTLAYVDLVDGPRVLVHLPGEAGPAAVGTAVSLVRVPDVSDVCAAVTR